MSTLRDLTSSKVMDYENGFYWFAGQKRFAKLFAHFEVFKKISNRENPVHSTQVLSVIGQIYSI